MAIHFHGDPQSSVRKRSASAGILPGPKKPRLGAVRASTWRRVPFTVALK